MPEFIPVPGVCRVALNITLIGQKCANIYHVTGPVEWGDGDFTTLANTFKTWWDTDIKPAAGGDVSLTSITCTDLTEQNSPGFEVGFAPPSTGSGGGSSLPGNVTFTVKWTTNLRGRSYRGRTYHIGVNPAHVTGNTLTGAWVTAFSTKYNNLLTALDTAGYQMVVVSRFHNKQARLFGLTTPVVGAVVEGNLDSQRRRLNTRGE